ncbi:MAG: hypothetical protein NPINA01_14580 [Nitrospinaceae bacterium]|nr:MAG: hypothetical protein NPINA01_14580 [Nitrospinaceae bacterium]
MNTELEILTSRDLKEKTINALGVETIYPFLMANPRKGMTPLEAAVKRFEENVSFGVVRDSDVIDIVFRHHDSHMAAKAINLLVELFKEKHIQIFGSSMSALYEKQLKIYEEKLRESENNLEIFKQKHKIFSGGEQTSLLLKQRVELDSTLKDTQNRIGELRQKIGSLEEQMQGIPKNEPNQSRGGGNRFQIIDEAKSNLLDLKRKESELVGKYKNFNAGIQLLSSVREEIKLVEDFIKKQEEELKESESLGRNIVHQKIELDLISARADLSSLGAKKENLEKQLDQLDKDLLVLDRKGQDYKMLLRKLDTNEKNYETYLRKSEEANVSKEMDQMKLDNIKVIQEATVPPKPIKPNKKLNVIMSVVLGAFSGLGLAFLSEYLTQGLSTPEEAERRLGLPVLTSVPHKG